MLGVQLPFERAAHTFEVLTGIGTSAREVERVTEERGLALDSQLAQERGQLLSGNFQVESGLRLRLRGCMGSSIGCRQSAIRGWVA